MGRLIASIDYLGTGGEEGEGREGAGRGMGGSGLGSPILFFLFTSVGIGSPSFSQPRRRGTRHFLSSLRH